MPCRPALRIVYVYLDCRQSRPLCQPLQSGCHLGCSCLPALCPPYCACAPMHVRPRLYCFHPCRMLSGELLHNCSQAFMSSFPHCGCLAADFVTAVCMWVCSCLSWALSDALLWARFAVWRCAVCTTLLHTFASQLYYPSQPTLDVLIEEISHSATLQGPVVSAVVVPMPSFAVCTDCQSSTSGGVLLLMFSGSFQCISMLWHCNSAVRCWYCDAQK